MIELRDAVESIDLLVQVNQQTVYPVSIFERLVCRNQGFRNFKLLELIELGVCHLRIELAKLCREHAHQVTERRLL